jgi:hypothetical protein
MKIILQKPAKLGCTRAVLELLPGEKLMVIRPDSHYRLGHPVDDVMASHIISEAEEVTWCSIEQKWV